MKPDKAREDMGIAAKKYVDALESNGSFMAAIGAREMWKRVLEAYDKAEKAPCPMRCCEGLPKEI